jgi:hypothetical protein
VTVRLRAHHLLCMLTYVGKGYTTGFTVNYDRVATRLNAGEDIEIVSGPDDICAPLLTDADAHCFSQSVVIRDQKAMASIAHLLGEAVGVHTHFTTDEALMKRLRSGFRDGTVRSACAGCEWADLCNEVAASNYCGVRIAPPLNR